MPPQTEQSSYNDTSYPIQPIWVLKNTIPSLILLPIFALVLSPTILAGISFSATSSSSIKGITYAAFYILLIPFHFFINVLRRATFHYQFQEKFLYLSQGIIKKQTRQLPYAVVQNVLVTQRILDRIFGLATLTIQNAASPAFSQNNKRAANQAANSAGFFGNTINIPGLTKESAQQLKEALLEKIKSSPARELGM